MSEFLIGTSAFANADPGLIRQAGIEWIRQDFPFPFADCIGGRLADAYVKAKEEARVWSNKGLYLMGVTPLHGIGGYKPDPSGKYQFVWNDLLPAYMGEPNSEVLSKNYQEICAFLADDLKGIVQMWQISNELNIPMFAGPLKYYYGCELIFHGAIGLKQSDPSLIVGPNSALPSMRYYFYGRLFADPRSSYLDYCGIDGYYGTWDPGGPEAWDFALAELYDLTHTRYPGQRMGIFLRRFHNGRGREPVGDPGMPGEEMALCLGEWAHPGYPGPIRARCDGSVL